MFKSILARCRTSFVHPFASTKLWRNFRETSKLCRKFCAVSLGKLLRHGWLSVLPIMVASSCSAFFKEVFSSWVLNSRASSSMSSPCIARWEASNRLISPFVSLESSCLNFPVSSLNLLSTSVLAQGINSACKLPFPTPPKKQQKRDRKKKKKEKKEH